MIGRYTLVLVLLVVARLAFSQTDTAYVLDQVNVSATSIKENAIGAKTYKWSADGTSSYTVSDLLTKEGLAYIKQYGPGTLATSAMRGGNANHTLVMWNGLPIQSPTLGLLDMSLLAIDNSDEVTLQEGGNSSMWGSGAIAGVIGLNTLQPKRNKIEIQSSIGAFHTYKNKIGVQLTKRKWTFDTRWLSHMAKNDYAIDIPSLGIDTKQINASQCMTHVMQSVSFVPKANQLLTMHYWYLDAHRQLPPTLTQTSSTADQIDLSHRLSVHYKAYGNSWIVNGRIAYFYEKNDFRADTFSKYALNRFNIKMADLTVDKTIGRHTFMLGGSWSDTEATTDGYKVPKVQHRYATYASHTFGIGKLAVQSGLRWESADALHSPLVPSIGIEYAMVNGIKARARLNRNFRFPTLNDLYWNPGGNISLLPESGWNKEAGIDGNHTLKNALFKYDITIYTRIIKNWIQWGRVNNDFYFSAINIAEVWSRGLSSNVSYTQSFNKITAHCKVSYALNNATHLKAATSPVIKKGEQLWYVPQHTWGLDVGIAYGKCTFNIDHHFFSETNGINENLAAYNLGNLSINYWFKIAKSKMVFFASINNYQNKNYFSVERRPSAGRYMEIGARYTFNL